MCQFWERLAKRRQPACKSYPTTLSAAKDTLMVAKLQFFAHVARMLQSFLTSYQYTKPMMPFLHDDLHQLLKDILSKFIKPEVLDQCKTSSSLCKLDFSIEKNYLKSPNIGFGASTIIKEKVAKEEVSLADVATFKTECRTFLKSMASKIVEKSSLKYAVVLNAKCLNPDIICNKEKLAREKLTSLVENLIQQKWLSEKDGDDVITQFKRYLERVVVHNREKFLKFCKVG